MTDRAALTREQVSEIIDKLKHANQPYEVLVALNRIADNYGDLYAERDVLKDQVVRDNEMLTILRADASTLMNQVGEWHTAVADLTRKLAEECRRKEEAYKEVEIQVRKVAESEKALKDDAWKAHVPVTGTQHDPANGLLHGYCARCRGDWPCEWSPEFKLREHQ